jgi:hypothetical protein
MQTDEYKQKVVDGGALVGLVTLLRSRDAGLRHQALAALHTVVKLPDVANKFVDVGAHTAMLSLLRTSETALDIQTLRPTTSALTYLCRNADAMPLVAAKLPSVVVPIAVSAKDAPSAANAMLCLTYLSRNGACLDSCLVSCQALTAMRAEATRDAIVQAGALAPAVSLLTPGSPPDAHSYAARLVFNIASSPTLRSAVVAAGGSGPLLKLVATPVHPSVHATVLDSVALLATDPVVAQAVVSAGLCPVVVGMAAGSTGGGAGSAAEEAMLRRAAGRIILALGSHAVTRRAIADAGALRACDKLVKSSDDALVTVGAAAIAALCAEETVRAELLNAARSTLVSLVGIATQKGGDWQPFVAKALALLAMDPNAEKPLVDSGSIPALLQLTHGGKSSLFPPMVFLVVADVCLQMIRRSVRLARRWPTSPVARICRARRRCKPV